MRLRFAVERSVLGQDWVALGTFPSPPNPNQMGYVSQMTDRIRVVCEGEPVEEWEWVERVPVNPGDLACTDYCAGWKLLWRKNAPAPCADELAHYYVGSN